MVGDGGNPAVAYMIDGPIRLGDCEFYSVLLSG